MPIYIPKEFNTAWMDATLKDNPTTVELALCLASSWSNPPTEAEVVASIIAPVDGYTYQDVTPASGATLAADVATITFANATISLTSNTLNYDAYCVIIDRGLAGETVAIACSQHDSAGSAHQFNGIKFETDPLVA